MNQHPGVLPPKAASTPRHLCATSPVLLNLSQNQGPFDTVQCLALTLTLRKPFSSAENISAARKWRCGEANALGLTKWRSPIGLLQYPAGETGNYLSGATALKIVFFIVSSPFSPN